MTRPRCVVTQATTRTAAGLRHSVGAAHLEMLRAVGFEPVPIAGDAPSATFDAAGAAHAVYLPGSDFVPEHLDQPEEEQARAAAGMSRDPWKVRADLAVLARALQAGLPVLGVCGGMQALALVAGGRLRPARDPASHGDGARHGLAVTAGTRLAAAIGAGEHDAGSWHRQVVAEPGSLRVAARADDGEIEAIEPEPGAPWRVGVQWHPEKEGDRRLYDALLQAALAPATHR